ncbi:MAG: class I SAM-dependent methyltransferase [Candidatus Bathyarchaeia archaeon]
MKFGATRLRSILPTQLKKPAAHAAFLEPLGFDYAVSSRHLRCLNKSGSKLYEIEFREGPPVGGLALAELVNPKADSTRIVDLGTGNGIIAIAMAAKGCASVFAVDVSDRDCKLALKNVRRNHKEHAIDVLRGDFASPLMSGAFDIIVANPPQLPTKVTMPDIQNFAGPTGYEAIDKIISQSEACLTSEGELWLYVLGFLGVERPTGSLPSLFERLRMFGFHPHVERNLRRRHSQDINIQKALPLIQDLYPMSDIARNFPKVGYYEAFVIRASRLVGEESR